MSKRPLDGIRVADFSWFGAGPIATQTLATFGAEVIRIESETKIDSLRVVHPFAMNEDGSFKNGYNISGYFNNFNAGKLGIQLNLNTEKGQELGYRIIEKSDIFLSNFTPRVIDKWNLRYEQISAINPRIIAAYQPMQGLEGPHKDFLGFGAVLTPVTGISYMSGFPHQGPIGVGTNYPDYVINPGHTITAVLAALRYRNRTGKGQRIELPQLESVVNTLGTAVADYLANGHEQFRSGNRSPIMAPHGAFRCADDAESVMSSDRWVIIALRNDGLWRKVVETIGGGQA
ncbi:MAG: CoA transferase, partial [Dehalococcoidia bacterium]